MTQKGLFPEPVNAREVMADEIWYEEKLPLYLEAIRRGIEEREKIQAIMAEGNAILNQVEEFEINDYEDRTNLYNILNDAAAKTIEINNEIAAGKDFLNKLHKEVCKIEGKIKQDLVTAEEVGKVKIKTWDTKEKQRIDQENAAKIAAAKAKQEQERKRLEEEAGKAETEEEKAALKAEATRVPQPLPELEQQNIKSENVVEIKNKSRLLYLIALRGCFSVSQEEKKQLFKIGGLKQDDINRLLFAFAILQQIRIPPDFPFLSDKCIKIVEAEVKKAISDIDAGWYVYGEKIDESNPKNDPGREREIEEQKKQSWGYVTEMAKTAKLQRKK